MSISGLKNILLKLQLNEVNLGELISNKQKSKKKIKKLQEFKKIKLQRVARLKIKKELHTLSRTII